MVPFVLDYRGDSKSPLVLLCIQVPGSDKTYIICYPFKYQAPHYYNCLIEMPTKAAWV
jgi:hypothetical protein